MVDRTGNDGDAQASHLLFVAAERLLHLEEAMTKARETLNNIGEDGGELDDPAVVEPDWQTLDLVKEIQDYRAERGWHPRGLGEARR